METLEILEKKSHFAEKIKRGDHLISSVFVGYVKQVKNERGTFLGHLKIFEEKIAQCQKNPKGEPLGTSGYVGSLENVKMKRGPLALSFLWPDLALGLSSLGSFCCKKSGPIRVRIVV